uniref:Uncharacterized protein n=1 Tax=Pseudo-nitzschia multistriata TaxID=183589 RepID=A0A448Z6W1_9STRA
MAKRNNMHNTSHANINTVRFSLAHVPEHHQDLCMGTKRSAWNSDEDYHSSKNRDRVALPPRRPSRIRKNPNGLNEEVFVSSGIDGQRMLPYREARQLSKPSTERKSILKKSKFSHRDSTISKIPSTSKCPESPNCSIASDDSSSAFDRGATSLCSSLLRNHRDSVLDLHRLARHRSGVNCPRKPSIADESITDSSILDDESDDDRSMSTLGQSNHTFGSNPPLTDLLLEM